MIKTRSLPRMSWRSNRTQMVPDNWVVGKHGCWSSGSCFHCIIITIAMPCRVSGENKASHFDITRVPL